MARRIRETISHRRRSPYYGGASEEIKEPMGRMYKLLLTEREMCDVLTGLERLKEHAANKEAEDRFQKLWEKITDIFEDRT
jgi:hypothetical protein